MCGRITQRSPPDQLSLLSVSLVEDVWGNDRRERYNGAPGQKHWVPTQHPATVRRSLDPLVWVLNAHALTWWQDGLTPTHTHAETCVNKHIYRPRSTLPTHEPRPSGIVTALHP